MVRAVSIQTGYLVEGKGAKSCTITYLAQVDPKGEGGDPNNPTPRGSAWTGGWVRAGRIWGAALEKVGSGGLESCWSYWSQSGHWGDTTRDVLGPFP